MGLQTVVGIERVVRHWLRSAGVWRLFLRQRSRAPGLREAYFSGANEDVVTSAIGSGRGPVVRLGFDVIGGVA